MKIMAFRCDNCGNVCDHNDSAGISVKTQTDLFSGKPYDEVELILESNSDHADCHFCIQCHNRAVATPAAAIKRNNGDENYTASYEALQKNFFLLVYRRYETNRRNATSKGERIVHNKNSNRRRK